jgi:hypothetical protein
MLGRLDPVGDLDRRRPPAAGRLAAHPYADIGVALARAAEEGAQKRAPLELEDGRCMALGKRRLGVDELLEHDPGAVLRR